MFHKQILITLGMLILSASVAIAQTGPRAGQQSRVEAGVITDMQAVTSEGKGSLGSTVVGGAVGGVLGNQVGGGSGKKIATGAGALLGARAGNRRSAARDTQTNVEFIIKLDTGATVSVVQAAGNATGFKKGDKVNVITSSDGNTRLTRG